MSLLILIFLTWSLWMFPMWITAASLPFAHHHGHFGSVLLIGSRNYFLSLYISLFTSIFHSQCHCTCFILVSTCLVDCLYLLIFGSPHLFCFGHRNPGSSSLFFSECTSDKIWRTIDSRSRAAKAYIHRLCCLNNGRAFPCTFIVTLVCPHHS